MACESGKKNIGSFKKMLNWYDDMIDGAFDAMGNFFQKIDPKGYLVATKLQHDLSDMLNNFNAHKADIYKSAGDMKSWLDEFDEGESAKIIQALNGDLDKSKLLDEDTLAAYERIRTLIDKNAEELVKVGALDEKSKIKDYIKRYYEKYLDGRGVIKKFFNDKKFKRADLSYEERVGLGMIEDAAYVVPRTLLEQRIQLLKANFFKQLDDKFSEDMQIGEDYVLVNKIELSSGIYKYGALSGKYVPLHVKKMLDDAHILKEQLGNMEKYLFPIIDHIKVNVTVKNPVTHLYNIASNLQVSAIQGSLRNTGRLIHMYKNDRPKFEALLKEVEPFGLDSMLADMEGVKVLSDKKGVNVVMTMLETLYLSEGSKVGKAIRKVYDWEDKIFKLAAYDHAKTQKAKRLGRELNDAEKLAVYKDAVAPYANYSTPLPAFFKLADKTGLSPFMHYVYKSSPAVAKLIAKHPIKYALIQTLLVESGASIWNDDDEALKPEWAGKNSKINLFMAKDWAGIPFMGKSWYWNAGRMMPGMKIGAIDASGGFIGGALNIANGKSPLGYDIGGKYDSLRESIAKRIMALAENYAPPISFGRYGQRSVKKLVGVEQKNYYKEDMSWQEMFSRALGVRRFNESDEVAKKFKAATNRLKHFMKEDPKSRNKYLKEYNKTVESIRRQAKAHKVVATPKKSRTRKIIPNPIHRNLVNFKKF